LLRFSDDEDSLQYGSFYTTRASVTLPDGTMMDPAQIQAVLALPYLPTMMTTGTFSGSGTPIDITVVNGNIYGPGGALQIWSPNQGSANPGITWGGVTYLP
jgi:hypothetical protein